MLKGGKKKIGRSPSDASQSNHSDYFLKEGTNED